jgi:hypothetical protein
MNAARIERQFPEVDTKSVSDVQQEVIQIFLRLFPRSDPACIKTAFELLEDAFSGRYPGYQAIDAKYHDFEHTLQGTLCFARLLEGYQLTRQTPPLTRRMFELAVLAILLHDTGYLKTTGDRQGTGAKYTLTHVIRSAEFAAQLLREQGFSPSEIQSIQNMIRCTGVNADLASIPFQSEIEMKVGFALGTADLLGQMAANDYIDKLGILFQEFDESNRYNNRFTGPGTFRSAVELQRNTPSFWEKYVIPKIKGDFMGLYHHLERAGGENLYIQKIEDNIRELRHRLDTLAA